VKGLAFGMDLNKVKDDDDRMGTGTYMGNVSVYLEGNAYLHEGASLGVVQVASRVQSKRGMIVEMRMGSQVISQVRAL
jgi:hypothetical protein